MFIEGPTPVRDAGMKFFLIREGTVPLPHTPDLQGKREFEAKACWELIPSQPAKPPAFCLHNLKTHKTQ